MGGRELYGSEAATCMSSQHLLNEIQQLRQDLAALSARVLVLEDRVERGAPSSAAASPLTVNYCGGSGLGGSGSFQDLPPLPEFSSPGSAITSQEVQTPVAPGAVVLSEAARLAIAEGAGRFLRRALAGDFRGGSGRDRVRLSSRIYVLVRDLSGRVYDPVEVYQNFSSLKPKVKSGDSAGNSIFIGFPTQWEAKAAVAAANLRWPDGTGTGSAGR